MNYTIERDESDYLDRQYELGAQKLEDEEADTRCRFQEVAVFDPSEVSKALLESEWADLQGRESDGSLEQPSKISSPYINAPLPLLGIMHGEDVHRRKAFEREDPRDRKAFCNFFRSYAICYYAQNLYRKTAKDEMNGLRYPEKTPTGFNRNNPRHRALGAAMFAMNRGGGSVKRIFGHWNTAREFMKERQLAECEQARFQISLKLLGPEYDFLSLRDLRVLMAVNSCMGEDGFGTISWRVLSWRAVGATNEAGLELLGVKPLGKHQVENALERLQKHGLIHRLEVRKGVDSRVTFVAKGTMSENVFHTLVADRVSKGKARRGVLRNGKLIVLGRLAE
jgi:hypothetical protein